MKRQKILIILTITLNLLLPIVFTNRSSAISVDYQSCAKQVNNAYSTEKRALCNIINTRCPQKTGMDLFDCAAKAEADYICAVKNHYVAGTPDYNECYRERYTKLKAGSDKPNDNSNSNTNNNNDNGNSGNSSGSGSGNSGTTTTTNTGDRTFLGLVTWDSGTTSFATGEVPQSEDILKSDIWTVAANIATDIAIIAAYLVIGYVIYGGYLYTFSYGDPSKIMNGKKTLTQAFIGLGITMSANLILGSLRIALISGGNIGNCATGVCVDPGEMVTNLINWFISIAGVASTIFLVYGGIMYITSTGDPGKVKKAKDMITYSLIGLAIVALSATITAFVAGNIRNANDNAFINNTIISKEIHEINYF